MERFAIKKLMAWKEDADRKPMVLRGARQVGKTWSRDELITYALGDDYDGFERSVDSYIKNIRKKLNDPEHDFIKTVYGFGYKLTDGEK